jgi:hypothetical protein
MPTITVLDLAGMIPAISKAAESPAETVAGDARADVTPFQPSESSGNAYASVGRKAKRSKRTAIIQEEDVADVDALTSRSSAVASALLEAPLAATPITAAIDSSPTLPDWIKSAASTIATVASVSTPAASVPALAPTGAALLSPAPPSLLSVASPATKRRPASSAATKALRRPAPSLSCAPADEEEIVPAEPVAAPSPPLSSAVESIRSRRRTQTATPTTATAATSVLSLLGGSKSTASKASKGVKSAKAITDEIVAAGTGVPFETLLLPAGSDSGADACRTMVGFKWMNLKAMGGVTGALPRWGHTCVNISSKSHHRLLVYGGEYDSKVLSDTWVLDLDSGTWQQPLASDGPEPRKWHSSAFIRDSRIVATFGGESDIEDDINCGLRVLDVDMMLSYPPSQVGKPPSHRSGHSMSLMTDPTTGKRRHAA